MNGILGDFTRAIRGGGSGRTGLDTSTTPLPGSPTPRSPCPPGFTYSSHQPAAAITSAYPGQSRTSAQQRTVPTDGDARARGVLTRVPRHRTLRLDSRGPKTARRAVVRLQPWRYRSASISDGVGTRAASPVHGGQSIDHIRHLYCYGTPHMQEWLCRHSARIRSMLFAE